MSGYYYPSNETSPSNKDFDSYQLYQTIPASSYEPYSALTGASSASSASTDQFYAAPQQLYNQPQQFGHPLDFRFGQRQTWMTPTVSSYFEPVFPTEAINGFPQLPQMTNRAPQVSNAGPSSSYLSPEEAIRPRASRSASCASSVQSYSESDASRSASPNASEMARWGYQNDSGTWSCAYPGCPSRLTFLRGCDLRKHYKRHAKSLFCRLEGCPQATEGGFSSKKDRARHEARHNPNVICDWDDCERVFSRVDNMKDHVRRVHKRRLTR